LVQRLFESIVATTTDLSKLEIVLYIDENDHNSRQIRHSTISVVKIVGRPGATMGSMNQACYEASHGRHVMLINDDVIFRSPRWNERILESAECFPDDIALIYGNDLDQGEAVPSFPILSRTACEVLGELCPRGYWHLHIESHLLDIFKQLARLGHRRICYLPDVVFEHVHYAVGKAPIDPVYQKKNRRKDDLLFMALDSERTAKAKALAQYIERRSSYSSEQARTGDGSPARFQQSEPSAGLGTVPIEEAAKSPHPELPRQSRVLLRLIKRLLNGW